MVRTGRGCAESGESMNERDKALKALQTNKTEENLWRCIVLFQNEEIPMLSGASFTYTLKRGKNGAYTKELWIDRRKESKSLSVSSVMLAFRSLLTLGDAPCVDRPKALGDIRGVSYSYALFAYFGLLKMPEKKSRAVKKDAPEQLKLWE